MEVTAAKLASLLIAAAYIVGCLICYGAGGALACFLLTIGPLLLIWFADEVGSYTGWAGHGPPIDTESPEWLVAGLGWLMLTAMPFAIYFKFVP